MDIFIYGAIGYEVDAKDIIADISKATDELNVHINSPGGNVYDGFAIFNALQKKRDILSTYIDGLAYSAASWLAISAPSERRYMSTASQFGIHQASNFAGGNKDELEKQLDALEKIDSIQVEIYSKATGLSEDRIKDIMSADRVLNLSEAKEFGFQEYQPEKIAALFKLNNMSKLDDLLKHFRGEEKAPEIEAQAEEKVKEAHAKAGTPAEALAAGFTAKKDFEELKASVEPFMTAIIDYIKEQPKQEEINATIKKEVNTAMVALLAQVKSEGTVPHAEETVFSEKSSEKESYEPLTLGGINKAELFKKN